MNKHELSSQYMTIGPSGLPACIFLAFYTAIRCNAPRLFRIKIYHFLTAIPQFYNLKLLRICTKYYTLRASHDSIQ